MAFSMKCIRMYLLLMWGAIIPLPVVTPAEAATQSNLTVQVIAMGDGGVYLGFTVRPTACAGEYNKTHGFISKANVNFDRYLALLALKRAQNQPVTITYEDVGDCTDAGSLLQISTVE